MWNLFVVFSLFNKWIYCIKLFSYVIGINIKQEENLGWSDNESDAEIKSLRKEKQEVCNIALFSFERFFYGVI